MQRHCENGAAVARFLNDHPGVDKVYWPGLPDHPNHDIARRQMRDFGGMLSFSLKGDRLEDANRVLSATKLFALAESLRSEEHTSELQSLMRISSAVFCLKKKKLIFRDKNRRHRTDDILVIQKRQSN